MRKIEARKKDRERKTQDLQKLITAADSGGSATAAAADHSPATHRGTPPDKKQQIRKKNTPFATPKAKLELLVTKLYFFFYNSLSLFNSLNDEIFHEI